MERRSCRGALSVSLVYLLAAFIFALFASDATLSYAASTKKKPPESTKSAVDYTESRIKQLSSALKITAEQEPLWNEVTKVMRENAKNMDELNKDRKEKIKTMNAVDSVKFHREMTQAQLEQQNKFLPPFETFYASLSDTQKATLDSIFRTGKHGKFRFK